MNLSVDERDIEVLRQALRNYVPNLREEIGKTENFEWRQAMKRDEEVLESLQARVEALASEGTATR
jgi:hypothetical protein